MNALPKKVQELIELNIKNTDNLQDILKNPSPFLLHRCAFFDHPDLFQNLVFDIHELEVFCTDETIKSLKDNKSDIPVKIVVSGEIINLPVESVKASFSEGCLIDYLP